MYIDGNLVTAGEKTRLHNDPFGVRVYDPEKTEPGYTLFSPAWGDQEYLIDMRGLVVHTWKVSHSNVAEILPNGNLFTHKCGYWLEELTPESERSGVGRVRQTWQPPTITISGWGIIWL